MDLTVKKTPISHFKIQMFDKMEMASSGYVILVIGACILFLFLIFTLIVMPLWECIFPKNEKQLENTGPGLLGTRCTFRWSIFQTDARDGFNPCLNVDEFPWFLFYVGGFFLVAIVVNYYENVKK
jgi:hypothetical protein